MRNQREIKADFLKGLDAHGDKLWASSGFMRKKGSLVYSRKYKESQQSIALFIDVKPRYQCDAEVCIRPVMHLAIESVNKVALGLVCGEKKLLANTPELIVSQPIEFSAPKEARTMWFASGPKEMELMVADIYDFSGRYVIPLLDICGTPEDLVGIYERRDSRMLKQRHWYIFVAAAEVVLGRRRGALAILEENLGGVSFRKKYSMAFDAVTNNSDHGVSVVDPL